MNVPISTARETIESKDRMGGIVMSERTRAFSRMLLCATLISHSTFILASDYVTIAKNKAMRAVLVDVDQLQRAQVAEIGRRECDAVTVCAVWVFVDRDLANEAAKLIKSGNVFDPTPGMVAIYSKNRVNDRLVCFEPKKRTC